MSVSGRNRSTDPHRAHVLVVNQHGENRGDEAAMRAMVDALRAELGETRTTIIVQFQDTSLELLFASDVRVLQMKMPVWSFLGLVAFSLGRSLGLNPKRLLDGHTRSMIAAYEDADLVISAPGGPYFGDLYYRHEIVHWFYIWLAYSYRKPVVLYAPSAGPFETRILNPLRRRLMRRMDAICVREEISRRYLRGLLGDGAEIHVTADSALQQSVEPLSRREYFVGQRAHLAQRYLVAVSAIDYAYPGHSAAEAKRREYQEALLRCLDHVGSRRPTHLLFFPQLYGKAKSDLGYLERLAARLGRALTWEIVDPSFDSDMQRRLFGMADLCIASRYHPQIFAAASAVPGICIYYEHKALGFMSALGLESLAFDIGNLDPAAMCSALDTVMERRPEFSRLLASRVEPLRERARETTQIAADVYRRHRAGLRSSIRIQDS